MNLEFQPTQASNFASDSDAVFGTITALLLFFTVVVFSLVLFFAMRYREGSKASRKGRVHHSNSVELMWGIPPIIMALGVFAWGAIVFYKMRTPPKDAMEVFVVGKRWMWHFQHGNGVRENNELHVPLGKPVKLTMISQDVIHAVYIPAFRVQYMVLPGRYTTMWFTATKKGKYPLFCNMYCGTQHSEMGGYVYVVDPQEYSAFLANNGNMKTALLSPAEEGKALYEKLQCGSCHAASDNDQGPSLMGIAGTNRPLKEGVALADDEYLREAIVDPYRRLTKGYDVSMADNYGKQLDETQVKSLVEYIKTLGAKAAPAKPAVTASNQ